MKVRTNFISKFCPYRICVIWPYPLRVVIIARASSVMEKLKYLRINCEGPLAIIEGSLTWNTSATQYYFSYNEVSWTFIPLAYISFLLCISLVPKECFVSARGASYLIQMTSQFKGVIISCDHNVHPMRSVDFIWSQLEGITLDLHMFWPTWTRNIVRRNRSRVAFVAITLKGGQWSRSHPVQLALLCNIQEIPFEKYIENAAWPPVRRSLQCARRKPQSTWWQNRWELVTLKPTVLTRLDLVLSPFEID